MAAKDATTKTRFTRRKFIRLTFGLALFGLGVEAAVVEPRSIEVTRHDVLAPRLPRELDGLKVAQLSDIHRSLIVPDSLIRSAVDQVNNLSPDIVVLTGDFVSHNAENAGPCAEMLSKLKPSIGIYAVIGNHDIWTDVKLVRKSLEEKGIRVLRNENEQPAPGLTLLGLDDYWVGKPDFDKTWEDVGPDTAHIFLCHNPGAVKRTSDRDCIMISGHTHGGQVNIPFVPRNKLPGLLGWKYVEGWHTVGSTRLYVNRGIGMVNPPVRLLCPPEVSLFTLRSA